MSHDPFDPTSPGSYRSGAAQPAAADRRAEESMEDVLARLADVVTEQHPTDSPAPPPSRTPTVSLASGEDEVEVTAGETQLVDLRLDPDWLRHADVGTVERLVRETVNRAVAEVREQLVRQMLSGSLAGEDVASRIARLQSEMHEAFQHDLARAVAPAKATAARFGEV